jgi:hypothetical protein
MARVGQAVTHNSHTLHFFWLKSTDISGRLMERAWVGQTAVQAPQWVHLFWMRFIS